MGLIGIRVRVADEGVGSGVCLFTRQASATVHQDISLMPRALVPTYALHGITKISRL
jgi:hypothetical protein